MLSVESFNIIHPVSVVFLGTIVELRDRRASYVAQVSSAL